MNVLALVTALIGHQKMEPNQYLEVLQLLAAEKAGFITVAQVEVVDLAEAAAEQAELVEVKQ
jgi:hypothetical protein